VLPEHPLYARGVGSAGRRSPKRATRTPVSRDLHV
jgi:hypothetical protein